MFWSVLSATRMGAEEKEDSLVTLRATSHFNLSMTREARFIIIQMFAYNKGIVTQSVKELVYQLHN